MLLTAFIIMKVFEGNYVTAVTQATLRHLLGCFASFAVLGYYMYKQKPLFDYLEEHSANEHEIAPKELLIETFKEAIPFIVVGSGVTVLNLSISLLSQTLCVCLRIIQIPNYESFSVFLMLIRTN